MAENEGQDPDEGRDPEGSKLNEAPGGRSSRGPNPDPGGKVEPGGPIPPYAGRTGTGSEPNAESSATVERQLAETKTGNPGATASPADEQPAQESDLSDEGVDSPKGVGVSHGTRGEDIADRDGKEAGRDDAGTKGPGRPKGTSDNRDQTSVDP